ncbi:3-deoxy-manno-octulosonate cytidylyltransferase [Pelagibacteraceae bacterium]|nr:3-deoxy-manno-octulosonate cytidylyltransferase [Pelagibacteraceae bacterium]
MKNKKNNYSVVGLIPVRLNSSRLFRKAILQIDSMPMVVHTYKRAKLSRKIKDVFICTDSKEIISIAKKYNCKFIKTGSAITGTDRISMAADKLKNKYDLYIDIQGDEPLVDPKHIDKVIDWHSKNMNFDIVVPSLKSKNIDTPHIVKIVQSKKKVLYFSRSLVPFPFKKKNNVYLKHLSVISFKPECLKKFKNLNESNLEKIEGIELMRALENNMSIGTFNLEGSSFSVDTKDDFLKAVKFMNIDKVRNKY